ncbi:MaoC/PaaZ C-terminal domain-containing protein [Patulibacter sp. NPDC049589]|uniref:MaoC/PaaZ C-terminal domain-containing protein n=1 Tax=Patulibacter sp. NPDC049589 TaxID=3154731 RepID=UPI00343ED410
MTGSPPAARTGHPPLDAAAAAAAVGAVLPPSVREWDADQAILYHLGVGAGHEPPGPRALRRVYERDLEVLPGFAATVAHRTGTAFDAIPGLRLQRRFAVHAEQEVVLHRPIPPAARAETTGRVTEIADTGRHALVRIATETRIDGEPCFSCRFGIVLRGAGGFGGPPPTPGGGPPRDASAREDGRSPDLRLAAAVSERQALLYRLLGDHNPLHVDPEHARGVGFDGPIVHGISTFGTALRILVDDALEGDTGRVTSARARFSGVVLPGDDLAFDVWWTGEGATLEVRAPARDALVMSASVGLRSDVPGPPADRA